MYGRKIYAKVSIDKETRAVCIYITAIINLCQHFLI